MTEPTSERIAELEAQVVRLKSYWDAALTRNEELERRLAAAMATIAKQDEVIENEFGPFGVTTDKAAK